MATTDELTGFVRDALARGKTRDEIRDVLLEAGWSADRVRDGLAGFATVSFPVPVPRPKPYVSAREAFMYLLMFAMLYTAAFNVVSLIFDLINLAIPDPAMAAEGPYTRQAIRWSAAAVMVSFPVFVFLSVLAARAVHRDPATRGSRVRRWVTYFTLLLAAAALIGDVTSLLYDVLGGEQTTRGMLKFLTVGVIAGAAFGYYLVDLKVDEKEGGAANPRIRNRAFLGGATVLVLGAVVSAVSMLGGPGEERVRRLDEKRVRDLTDVRMHVDAFWAREHRLPASLAEAATRTGASALDHDPESGAPYEYRTTGDTQYELCATFARPSGDAWMGGTVWAHPAGRQCFSLDAKH